MIEKYEKLGWKYIDPNTKFSPEMWDFFLNVFGDDNFVLVAISKGTDEQGKWIRGQLMISPDGWNNLISHNQKNKLESEK